MIIGKTINQSDDTKKDISTISRHNEDGIVDKVIVTNNEQGSTMVKVRVRNMKTPTIGDKFCYDNSHACLTERGWVPITEVKLGERVMTLDPSTNTMAYEPTTDIHHYNITDEDMYELDTPDVSLKVTLNHKMYVKKKKSFSLVEAKKIVGKSVRYMKNCEKGLRPDQCRLPSEHTTEAFDDILLFLGHIIAGQEIQDIQQYLERYGPHDWRLYPNVDPIVLLLDGLLERNVRLLKNVESDQVVDNILFFLSHILADKSRPVPMLQKIIERHGLPNWCFYLDVDQTRLLLQGMLKRNEHSDKILDDLQRLLLQAGWSVISKSTGPFGSTKKTISPK